jgi:hypothetical protein
MPLNFASRRTLFASGTGIAVKNFSLAMVANRLPIFIAIIWLIR